MGNTDRSFNIFERTRNVVSGMFKPKLKLQSRQAKQTKDHNIGYYYRGGRHSTDFEQHLKRIHCRQNIRRYVHNATGKLGDTVQNRIDRLTPRGRKIYSSLV